MYMIIYLFTFLLIDRIKSLSLYLPTYFGSQSKTTVLNITFTHKSTIMPEIAIIWKNRALKSDVLIISDSNSNDNLSRIFLWMDLQYQQHQLLMFQFSTIRRSRMSLFSNSSSQYVTLHSWNQSDKWSIQWRNSIFSCMVENGITSNITMYQYAIYFYIMSRFFQQPLLVMYQWTNYYL